MVAQVVAAPVMMVGRVAAAVVKTGVSVAMRAGSAAMKAGVSAAKSVGSAVRSGVTNTVSTAGRMGKGLLSSVRSGPLSSRFSALSNARAGAAKVPPRSAMRSPPIRSPVGRAVQRATARSEARERRQMPRQDHAIDQRDRVIIELLIQAQKKEEDSKDRGVIMKMAKFAHDTAKKILLAPVRASMAVQQQMEHNDRTSRGLER